MTAEMSWMFRTMAHSSSAHCVTLPLTTVRKAHAARPHQNATLLLCAPSAEPPHVQHHQAVAFAKAAADNRTCEAQEQGNCSPVDVCRSLYLDPKALWGCWLSLLLTHPLREQQDW
jgi:hypothetical protein